MSVIPIKGLKPEMEREVAERYQRPNERHPDQGIETREAACSDRSCRAAGPNERHPDQGIETRGRATTTTPGTSSE